MNRKAIAGLLAAGAIALGAAACSSGATAATPPAASAPATSAASAPAATTASDTQVCNAVNTWESNNDGLAATNFGADTASEGIVTEASGTSAVDTDVTQLSDDTGSSAATDISSLATDCATAGVTLTGSDFSSGSATPAAPAPAATTAPAMSAAQQQAVDSAQSYLADGQGFSATGLFKQLTSSYGEGFTEAQAEYAVSQAGL